MPFHYPNEPHIRKHRPAGYGDWSSYKPWLRDEFVFRCVYCLEREMWNPHREDAFSVDHIMPRRLAQELEFDYSNLVYACVRCNARKSDVLTVNPMKQALGKHLRMCRDFTVEGMSIEGRALVKLLHLNCEAAVRTRRFYSEIESLHRKYPDDAGVNELYHQAFRYPENLPNLERLRPPDGNSATGSETKCWYSQRDAGLLTAIY